MGSLATEVAATKAPSRPAPTPRAGVVTRLPAQADAPGLSTCHLPIDGFGAGRWQEETMADGRSEEKREWFTDEPYVESRRWRRERSRPRTRSASWKRIATPRKTPPAARARPQLAAWTMAGNLPVRHAPWEAGAGPLRRRFNSRAGSILRARIQGRGATG